MTDKTKTEKSPEEEQDNKAQRNELRGSPYLIATAVKFLKSQKEAFERDSHLMPLKNHSQHDEDPDYWTLLLEQPLRNPHLFMNTKALDFGCGCGRNLRNLLSLAPFSRVDGVDISPSNALYAHNWMQKIAPGKAKAWETGGYNLGPDVEDETYSFIMSHVVFQHIGNYTVRCSILKDMYRALVPNGVVSLHFMDLRDNSVGYYTNSPIGNYNCRVPDPMFIYRDLEEVGFENISIKMRLDKYSGLPSYFVQAKKSLTTIPNVKIPAAAEEK